MTNAATGKRHENGLYDMYVRHSDFKFITHYEWNTEMIGFKEDGADQYKWVIEYQCGTRPDLPQVLCLGSTIDGKCFFTGLQMFVFDRNNVAEGRREMIEYLRSLCQNETASEEVAWVMDDFGGGTFPRWFKNVTWRDDCPLPCAHGVYHESAQMWGCPSEDARIASPAWTGDVAGELH